jgi:transcriptional regulator with XRE-family HTH domain
MESEEPPDPQDQAQDQAQDEAAGTAKEAAKWRRAQEVAARVRAVRGFRGYSQAELAERTGLSRQYVSELEQGKRPKPRGETLERLAEALDVTADQLRGCAPLSTGGAAEPSPRPAPPDEAQGTARPAQGLPRAEVEMWHTTLRDGSLVIQIRTNGAPAPRPSRRRRRPRGPRPE